MLASGSNNKPLNPISEDTIQAVAADLKLEPSQCFALQTAMRSKVWASQLLICSPTMLSSISIPVRFAYYNHYYTRLNNQGVPEFHAILNLLLIPYVLQVTAIMGPAGCGKSHVSLAIMQARFLAAQRVLVTGPTNTLVDNLCDAWATTSGLTGPAIVRLYSKIQHDSGKANELYCAHALAVRYQLTVKEVLHNATFVFATNALALSPSLQGDFHHHIVDEAGRTNIPMGIALTACAKNITFIGDSNQLHPHTNLEKHYANELELTTEDMSRLIDDSKISILHMCAAGLVPHACIIEQHRMNKRLTDFINTFFCGLMVGSGGGQEPSYTLPNKSCIKLIDTSANAAFVPVDELFNLTCSAFQPRVATSAFSSIAARHVNDVLHYAQNDWPKGSVAIISNHYEQNRLNKALFSSHESVSAIDTLGRFQGSQADVVILTLASIHPGFFTETTRQYVASSRARQALIIIGEIAKWKAHQQIRPLFEALEAMQQNASLPTTRVHTLAALPKFVDNACSNDWVVCRWSPMNDCCMHGTLYHDTIMSSIQASLHNHFNSYFTVKFGRILLPDCSWLFTNILAFPVPDVPQYQSLIDSMDAAVFHNVECRQLYDWEREILREIPRNFRKTLTRQNKRYTLTVQLVQALYHNFFTKCRSAFHHNLLTHLYGLLPQHGTCDQTTHTHGSNISSTICTWCHVLPTPSLSSQITGYNAPQVQADLIHTFITDVAADVTYFEPTKIAVGCPLQFFKMAREFLPFTKWQMNDDKDHRGFPGGGRSVQTTPQIAKLFTQLNLQSGNAIFRNVFNDTTASAKPHIDSDCFQRNRTFLWHFGPPSYLRWGNSKYPLEHAALYAFDAACTHSVPLMGRYSLSIRSWN